MKKTLAALLLLAPFAASAAAAGFVDGYFIPSAKLDFTIPGFGSFDDDGDGFGVRGMAPIAEAAVLTGEYQSVTYDDSDIDLDQLRIGLGFIGATGSGIYGEYAKLDLDNSEADGPGLHLRLNAKTSDTANLYGQIGYLMLKDDSDEDLKGLEFSVGAAVALGPQWGGFVEFRRLSLEDKMDDEFEFSDFRVGIRLSI